MPVFENYGLLKNGDRKDNNEQSWSGDNRAACKDPHPYKPALASKDFGENNDAPMTEADPNIIGMGFMELLSCLLYKRAARFLIIVILK